MRVPRSEPGLLWTIGMLVVLTTAPPVVAQGEPAVTTVVLVRHAEKIDASRDPRLSQAGEERAHQLAHVLADFPFEAVLSTPFIRTRETGRPVAAQMGLPVTETPVTRTFASDLAARLRTDYAGQTVLVVGHSNTTPDVMRALGVPDVAAIADNEYDDLFIVTLLPGGSARAVHMHYGRPTP